MTSVGFLCFSRKTAKYEIELFIPFNVIFMLLYRISDRVNHPSYQLNGIVTYDVTIMALVYLLSLCVFLVIFVSYGTRCLM